MVNVQINSVRLQCVTWDNLEFITTNHQVDASSTVERMFVRTYKNGCRPRYECIQLRVASIGVLLYRRSRYRLWPFNGTTGIVVDCRSLFTYDETWYQLLVSASGLHTWCRLPLNVVDEELGVELKSGLRCRGFIRLVTPSKGEGNYMTTGFKLLLRDCPMGHHSEQVYRCLDSIGQYNGDIQAMDGASAVLVSANSAGGDLLCWWFGHNNTSRFFLLSAPSCYDERMAATVKPLAVFTRLLSAFTTDYATTTSVSAYSREYTDSEKEQVTDETNNLATYWQLFLASLLVVNLLRIC